MKMIGKLDESPVFEVEEGKYIAVSPERETCMPMWSWYAVLGKWAETFEKCSESPDELRCLDLIEQNKEQLAEALNSYADEVASEGGKVMLEEQKEFYDWLEDNREYNYFEGYTDEIEDY